MRPFARVAPLSIGLLFVAAVAASCGGGGDEPTPTPTAGETGSPTAGGVSEDDIRACLQSAGLAITAEGDEAPTLSSVKAIGVDPGDGGLGPGNVTAAVFVFDSEESAASAAETLQQFGGQVDQEGSIVVMYDTDAPEAGLSAAIDGCVAA